MHGRGTCDMKAGVVANLAAVRAVRAAGIALTRPYALQLVVGEEDGGLGAFATLDRGHRGKACIITEPTSGTITTANAGALTFELRVPGVATHASTSYAGVSALEKFLPLHAALARLQERRNRDVHPLMAEYPIAYPLSIGKVSCGDWASTVPDLLVAEGRLGVALGEDPESARAELEEAVADAAGADPWLRDHPPTVAWTGGQFASGEYAEADRALHDLVATAHADVTTRTPPARARSAVRQRPAALRRRRRADAPLRSRRRAARARTRGVGADRRARRGHREPGARAGPRLLLTRLGTCASPWSSAPAVRVATPTSGPSPRSRRVGTRSSPSPARRWAPSSVACTPPACSTSTPRGPAP